MGEAEIFKLYVLLLSSASVHRCVSAYNARIEYNIVNQHGLETT